ncbi:hypothetical protein V492_01640 [Pseudogymnoascus sp. VKM F-4246]|nr:hypothetical protein V492_01640 [Pseudogymnoascus sp. VKM F-4246]
MHDMMGQYGMDDDPNHQQRSEQQGTYSNDVWGGIPASSYSSSQQTSPVYEYQNYQFMNHGLPPSLPEEPTFTRMPPPPPPQQQTLLPLLPAPDWMRNMSPMSSLPLTMPSMLTNPRGFQGPPVTIPPSPPQVKPSKPLPRKTLKLEERRQMCQLHTTRPDLKQAEIGKLFGVERSTVSKVLREKEKFLSLDERSVPPPRKPKGKVQDIDLTLSNWWQKKQDIGVFPTRDEIREQGIKFASSIGSKEGRQRENDDRWLDEFIRNHNCKIKTEKRKSRKKIPRRASETNISDITTSAGSSVANTPAGQSPDSPLDFASPLSGFKDDHDYTPFSSNGYRLANSRSTTSLSSNFTDTTVGSSFSREASSPATPFSFSPETTQGPFAPPQYVRAIEPSYLQRPRSQTFPILPADPDTATTATFPHHSVSPPALDASSDAIVTTPATSASSASTSPTQDDARLALETLISYMESAAPQGLVNEAEYQTVVKLTERMRQHRIGSLSGIAGGDNTESVSMECNIV